MGFGLVLYLIICVLLIAVSLLNQSQSGGLGILSGSSQTLLGSTNATFLSKVISFLAVIFFIGALFFSIISSGERTVLDDASPDAPPTEAPADDDILNPDVLDEQLDLTPDPSSPTPLNEQPPESEPLAPEGDLVPLSPIEENNN
ncbi:hypothetical protein COTS27_00726 [Spirochaetota bacterium]|nr:hypothetical protein COTS27_00726 [Spirochaetota bacterium]